MKKKIFGLFTIMCISLLCFTNVYALEVVEAGDSVVSEGNYDSTRLIAGNKVVNNSTVDGISFVAGNEVILEGNSTYGFYAGNTLSVKEKIEKDAFIAGNGINILPESTIGRDAYIAGNAIKISGNIGRNLNAGGMSINLSGATINGDAYIASDVILLDEDTVINGKLTYSEDASISGLDKATIGSVEIKKMDKTVVTYNPIDSFYAFAINAIAAFITLLVLFYLIPKSKEKLDDVKYDGNTIFKTLLYGLAVLFLVPIASIICLFTGFLTPLSLITLAIYGISIYLAYLLSYYIVGNVITTKLLKKDNVYIASVIGIILVKLLKLIPTLGGFVSLICLLYGLGLVFDFIKSRGK